MKIHLLASLGGLLAMLLSGASSSFAAEQDTAFPAIILKVEGDGIANVRKHSGIVESAGARGKLYAGDRIITDGHSAVSLMLNDGSVIKVGFSSEFLLEKVENKHSYLGWLFSLVRGSIRSLVEKVPTQDTHLRIETKTGTIGIRGTEFVLVYDDAASASSLYLIEGLAIYGADGCDKTKSCVSVKTGEAASMAKGKPAPTAPQKYGVKELFALGQAASPGAATDARMSLFRDARRIQTKYIANADEGSLKKIIDDASQELAAAQDRAIGRTKEQREAMHEAIKNGSYQATLAAADAYAESQGIFNHSSNAGAENLVAQVAASKFRLGEAVTKAEAAGLFLDKATAAKVAAGAAPSPSGDGDNAPGAGAEASVRSFKMRKNVGYDQSADAKSAKEALGKAADDYKDTLEYAEALSADQVPGGDSKATDTDISSPDSSAAPAPAKDPGHCRTSECQMNRAAHELDVSSEGVVNAFQDRKSDNASGTPSRHGRGGRPGSVGTRYFKRTVPGDGCFKTVQKCSMQPCAGFSRGNKCKAGETVLSCDSTHIPVRCEDSK
ncbi:MAG: FecR family protein [Bdellovibrionota bacterium]